MKVNASHYSITVVDHEDYINQFNGTQFAKGGRCDFMMFDAETHRKVILCDLGCYSQEYVEKKQVKSRQQVYDSIGRFLRQQCGKDFLNLFAEKILIFGRRDPALNSDTTPTPASGNVKGNMQAFLTNPFSKSKFAESKETIDDTNVIFLIVNYLEPYIW